LDQHRQQRQKDEDLVNVRMKAKEELDESIDVIQFYMKILSIFLFFLRDGQKKMVLETILELFWLLLTKFYGRELSGNLFRLDSC
jgi:hypothetical protein